MSYPTQVDMTFSGGASGRRSDELRRACERYEAAMADTTWRGKLERSMALSAIRGHLEVEPELVAGLPDSVVEGLR